MSWRLAESLKQLRDQLNKMYPTRSKVSDGFLGDQAHSSRASDHNPNKDGVVTAGDFTNDSKTLKGQWLADALAASRDPRIKYIIFDHQMCRSYPAHGKPAWTWQPYSGANSHEHHVHLSVSADKALYDSTRSWNLGAPIERVATVPDDDIQHPVSPETSSPAAPLAQSDPETPPQQTASLSVKDGDIEMKMSDAPPPVPEKVAIEKPPAVGFAASMKRKVFGVTGGNALLQGVRDYAEDVKALSLSARFWVWISIIAIVGGLVWLAVEVYKHWSGNKKEMEITNSLIAANSTPNNRVVLVDADKIEDYKERGYKIVYR